MNLRQEREAKALGRAIRRARFEAGLMNPGSPKNSARRNRGSRASSAAISIAASTISSRSPARFTKSIGLAGVPMLRDVEGAEAADLLDTFVIPVAQIARAWRQPHLDGEAAVPRRLWDLDILQNERHARRSFLDCTPYLGPGQFSSGQYDRRGSSVQNERVERGERQPRPRVGNWPRRLHAHPNEAQIAQEIENSWVDDLAARQVVVRVADVSRPHAVADNGVAAPAQ